MAAPALDEMADRYADRGVHSVFVYTREAHPGEHYGPHRTFEDKRHHARAMRDVVGVRRKVLVDDLDGTAHKAYGMLPNMTWIVGRGGLVFYRAAWTIPEDIEDAVRSTLDGLSRKRGGLTMPCYSERLIWRETDDEGFRKGLERNGPQAVSDFYTEALEKFRQRHQQS